MSSTLSKLLANRLNALRSTGPSTAEGKARSSQNARTHGLSNVGAHPPADMLAAIEKRNAQWRNDYRPEGPAQDWAFDRLVAESVRLDCCEARISAARSEAALRASESWDDDQAATIAALGSRLAHSPNRIQPSLLQSKHGVLWLLERWGEVAVSLRQHKGWTFPTWNKALDLLGVPTPARDGSGPWDLDPDDKTESPGLDLVQRSTEALRSRLDSYLNDRDARARFDAELGLSADDPPSIRLLERYAADARRRVSFFMNELRRLQSLAARSSAPASASSVSAPAVPVGPPGPRPDRTGRRSRAVPESTPAPPSPATSDAPSAPNPPLRNEPKVDRPSVAVGSLRQAIPGSSAPLNRRARRAQAAAARRS